MRPTTLLAAVAVLAALPASAAAANPVQGSVFGPIVSVKGTTFTLTTSLSPSGKSLVSAKTATITEQATAPRSSLKVGACVMAVGTRNSKGVVAASRITVSAPVNGRCGGGVGSRGGTRPGGTPPTGSGGAGRPPGGGFGGNAGFGFAFGSVTKVQGSTLTVKGSFGSTTRTTTVTVGTKTALEHTIEVKSSAIKVKLCAFVRGSSTDKGVTVTATDISLSPETNGTCTNGFRRPGA